MISWPATPGKKYLLPPEKPTTSCGNTGPTTSATSCSTTARLSAHRRRRRSSRPSGQLGDPVGADRARGRRRSPGSHHSWLTHGHPGIGRRQPARRRSRGGRPAPRRSSRRGCRARPARSAGVTRPCSAPWTAPTAAAAAGSCGCRRARARRRCARRAASAASCSCDERATPRRRTGSRRRRRPSWRRGRRARAGSSVDEALSTCSPRITLAASLTDRQAVTATGGNRLPGDAPVGGAGRMTAMSDAAPVSHPGPAAAGRPGGARDRAAAVRSGARPADHLPARPRRRREWLARRHPVRRPDHPARHPGPLRHPAAARQRRRRWTTSASATRRRLAEPRARAAWRLLCAHWAAVPRHARSGSGSRASWPTSSASTQRPCAETADAIYDQIAERLRPTSFRPRALFERFGIEVLATTDDPCDDLAAHAALAADPSFDGRVIPTFRPDRYLEPAPPGWPQRVDRLGEASAESTPATTPGYVARAGGAPALLHRPRRDLRRPQPRRRRAPTRWTPRRRPGSTARRCAGEHVDRGGDRVPPAHAARDGPDVVRRRAGDDAAPGRAPQPPRARRSTRFGADTGHDIPIAVEFTGALQPLLERFGTAPGLPPGAVHRRRDRLLPRDRAAGRLLPVGVRRRAVVVPRRARGDPPLPRRRHRDRRASPGPPASSTTPARSARSRPGTTCPAASTAASWPSWSPQHRLDEDEALETARRPRRPPARDRCSSCERASLPDRAT